MPTKLKDKRLYWRGGIIWCRVLGNGGEYVRKSTRCRTEAGAIAVADEFELRAADPSYAAASKATLGETLTALFADIDRRGRADATKKKAGQKVGHFVRLWGVDMTLSRITSELVLAYIDQRQAEGVVNGTIKDELGHLRQALKLARHAGTFRMELDRIFPPFFTSGHKPRDRWPTPGEMDKLVLELEEDRAAHIVYILATGARLGEAARAHRTDADWQRGIVKVRGTKTALAAGDVPITTVNAPLLSWAVRRAPGADVLFRSWGKLHRDLAAACERAGIQKLTPNDLRRGFARWHLLAGVDINRISKMLRHSTDKLAQTTYAKATGEEIGKLVAAQIRELPALAFTAGAPVPDLYMTPASKPIQTVETDTEGHPSTNDSPQKTAKNKVPPEELESTTFALGKLSCESPKLPQRQAVMPTLSATCVPNLYGSHAGSAADRKSAGTLPPWAREAVGVLRGLAVARGMEMGT